MSQNIKLKRSAVPGKVPQTSDLELGELALNFADGRIYYKTVSDEIDYFQRYSQTSVLGEELDCGLVSDLTISSSIDLQIVTGSVTESYDLGFLVVSGNISPNVFILPIYSADNLPTGQEGQLIYVSNDIGGPTLAFFDGSNWKRTSDNQNVSI